MWKIKVVEKKTYSGIKPLCFWCNIAEMGEKKGGWSGLWILKGSLVGVGDIIRSKIAGNPVLFMVEKYTLVVMEVVKIPEIRSFNM